MGYEYKYDTHPIKVMRYIICLIIPARIIDTGVCSNCFVFVFVQWLALCVVDVND